MRIVAQVPGEQLVRLELVELERQGVLEFPNYPMAIDLDKRVVTSEDRMLRPSRLQFGLLSLLAVNADMVIDYNTTMIHLWGVVDRSAQNALKVHKSVLNKSIRRELTVPEPITTCTGVGYMFNSTPLSPAI